MSDEYIAGDPLPPDAQAFLDKKEGKPVEEKAPAVAEPEPKAIAEPAESVETPPTRQAAPDEEDLARKLGWAPKDQWRGADDKWVDAATFLERASPTHWEKKFREYDEQQTRTLERLERLNQTALDNAREQAAKEIAALKAERAQLRVQYARAEDWESLERLDQVYEDAVAEVQGKVQPVEPSAPDPVVVAVQSEQQKWVSRRPEFASNPEFQAVAFAVMGQVNRELGDSKPPAEHFAELDRRLARRFPEIYREQAADTGAPPADRDLGGVRIGGKTSTNYASRLPSYARAQGERFVKQGLYKSIEDYAKEFANDG